MQFDTFRKREAQKLFRKGSPQFEQLNLDEMRTDPKWEGKIPSWMTRCFRNNLYTVMVMDNAPTTAGPAIRIMVQKHDDRPLVSHWASMQRIKNEIFGKQTMAIEYYPADADVQDMHNIYWMWIFPEGIIPKAIL